MGNHNLLIQLPSGNLTQSFNMAIEIVTLGIKMVIFHRYASLPEGIFGTRAYDLLAVATYDSWNAPFKHSKDKKGFSSRVTNKKYSSPFIIMNCDSLPSDICKSHHEVNYPGICSSQLSNIINHEINQSTTCNQLRPKSYWTYQSFVYVYIYIYIHM